MEQRSKNFPIIVLGALIAFSAGAIAQSPVATGDRADNTATNVRDRGDTTKPTDQSNAKQDIQVAATVRRAIVADKSLSTKAHNVKLVANSGAVTLRGPVENDAEKTKVEAIAKGVAGVTTVNNDLDVKNTNN
jgi:hyperosmotically inducible protein